MKKTITLFLLCSLITSLVSCGEAAPSNDTTAGTDSGAADTTEPLSFADAHAQTKDGLPAMDFGGEEFVITINNYTGCEAGFLAEETNGDVLNDAVYKRNIAVEERFNVKLKYESDTYNTFAAQVTKSVTAGDDYYQLCNQHAATALPWVTGGILMNWQEMPHVDFSQPWWSPSNDADLTYNGRAYLAVGDFGLTTIGRTYAIYYDMVEAESNKLPDLYEMVYDGKWTFDTMLSYTKDTYRDLNSNGKEDTFEDLYGFSTSVATNVSAFYWAFGGKIMDKGEMVLDIEKMADIATKMIDVCWNYPGTAYDPGYANASGNRNYLGVEKMAQGTTLFAAAMIDSGILYLRDSVNDYGILPYPKWDEAQKDYYTVVDLGFTVMGIPKSVVNVERAGILAEALCAETYRTVVSPYYEMAIKQKGARNEESIEMIDFVLSKRVYDFGLLYDGFKGFGFTLERLVQEQNENFASYYAANINSIQAHYDSVLEVFTAEE